MDFAAIVALRVVIVTMEHIVMHFSVAVQPALATSSAATAMVTAVTHSKGSFSLPLRYRLRQTASRQLLHDSIHSMITKTAKSISVSFGVLAMLLHSSHLTLMEMVEFLLRNSIRMQECL